MVSLLKPLDFHLLSTDTVSFIPVQFSFADLIFSISPIISKCIGDFTR